MPTSKAAVFCEIVRCASQVTPPSKQGDLRIALAAVGGTRYRHLCAVHAVAGAEINDNVAIKKISARVENQRGIRAKAGVVGALEWRRKRQVNGTPVGSTVDGEKTAHGIAEDLVRARGDGFCRSRI